MRTWKHWISIGVVPLVTGILGTSSRAQNGPEDVEVAEPLRYVRIYSDSEGASHFSDAEFSFALVDFAPPSPPISVSDILTAAGVGIISSPVGWYGDWRPAPHRQLLFCLAGELEVQVSDGEVRRFAPGAVVLVEDTSGQGHITKVVGTERAYLATVPLSE